MRSTHKNLSQLKSTDWQDSNYNMEIDEKIRRFARIHPRRMELGKILAEWLRNPNKEDFKELKSKNFPGGACSRIPLEACAFGSRLGNRSFITEPRSDELKIHRPWGG